jgi:hypothetical protein
MELIYDISAFLPKEHCDTPIAAWHPTDLPFITDPFGSMFDSVLDVLETELRAALNTAVTGLVATARTRLEGAVAKIAEKRADGFAKVAKERTTALAEINARRGELSWEVEAMQTHQAKQAGHVELNIGGYRF